MRNFSMAKFGSLLIVLFLSYPLNILAQYVVGPGDTASITVVTENLGSLVIINDDSVGTTPIFAHPVKAGKHKVTVQRINKQSWFASDWTGTYDVEPGDSLVLHPAFRLTYHIQSKPYGAMVYNNEVFQGETPLVLEYDESENNRLVLEKKGYFSQVVDCKPMGEHLIKVVLEADDDYWIEQEILQRKIKTKISRRKKYTYLSTALSLASGVSAVWLKNRADKYYEDYKSEIDPQKMDTLFDKAEQYDRLSTVAFGALQVSFGFSLYFFVKSNSAH
ncbi:MAG: PEGA domain-containing protein [Calditrichaeota bacterium]|nr:MAG: PEGA domain-containing protein [Calditrichota bacterium]